MVALCSTMCQHLYSSLVLKLNQIASTACMSSRLQVYMASANARVHADLAFQNIADKSKASSGNAQSLLM